MMMILINTIEGGGKMDWNNPVVDEEDEEETLGPKRWSKDEDEEEPDTDFFLSMNRFFQLYVVYFLLYVKKVSPLCSS